MNTVIVGAQWGDEGKGKIIDILSARADCIVRYQGGSERRPYGRWLGKRICFSSYPSGILHSSAICCIGNGVTVDPAALLDEIKGLAAARIPVAGGLRSHPWRTLSCLTTGPG